MGRKNKLKQLLLLIAVLLAVIVGTVYYCVFNPIFTMDKTVYLHIDRDDTTDSVYAKINLITNPRTLSGLKTLGRYRNYRSSIKTGRYAIEPKMNAWNLHRRLRGGMQTPVRITIPSVRTMERLAAHVSQNLMVDSTEIITSLLNDSICNELGFDTTTLYAFFIPNTYEVYWDISVEKLLQRMKKEYISFWNETRRQKAKSINLSPIEVSTLASIIDEETAYNPEKPTVAGMYLNRIRKKMPLQADPTIKFALKQFELKRIYYDMLTIKSPYNTYTNIGLPPGPIRIPTLSSVEAVLNATSHHYLYMCAKEDFSGSHNFAGTYSQHLVNAAKYRQALNKQGVR